MVIHMAVNTKERILISSLELFAQKGYSGVSVRDIAKVVGVRESALYKHYKNKQDILDSIMELMKGRITKAYQENQIPEVVTENVAEAYGALTDEMLCQMTWNLFQLYVKDPIVANYRKLLMREQFSNEQAAGAYFEIYLSGVVKRQAQTFKKLIDGGLFREENPETIALQFYGPIFLLFQQYDNNPGNEEEIKENLFGHVKAFGKSYSRKR